MASDLAGVFLEFAALLIITAIYASTFWRAESMAKVNKNLMAEHARLVDQLEAKHLAYAELERNYLTCINAGECDELRKQLQQSQLVCNAYREQIDAMRAEWTEMSGRMCTVVKGVTSE